ncbi:MAG: glycosyltransferase family 2 protein [Pseudomonadota bacterium]
MSIVVTFYDETPFLRTALTSVLNQGIDDLELIIVNDNPERFSAADLAALTAGTGARVLHHTVNKGLSAARNTGIAAANGEWIGFLDADDYYTIGGLRAQLNYARETGADITHAACYLGEVGGPSGRVLMRDAKLHMQRRVVQGRMAAQEAQFIVSSWSSLYRTDFLEQEDLWFDIAQRKFEDRLFVLTVITRARRIAFLGEAVRVWRQRANSISSAATTPEVHLLQVQLLEKCRALMERESAKQKLPARYTKRELFNCVSRLIWDMDILPHLAAGDPAYTEMGARIVALLGTDSFGNAIFDDPMVAATSRVGMRTKRGLITRTDFFALHKALREGDFASAQALLEDRAPVPARRSPKATHSTKRLVLHVGLHKTGTTFVQHHLLAHRDTLRRAGILVPQTGFETDVDGRPGALSGHQGLVRALRSGEDATWRALHREISRSPARTVVISAENFSFPTAPDRDDLIAQLAAELGRWGQVSVIAMARRPDSFAEAFWREWVSHGHPAGCRSLPEFLVDQQDSLTDFPALFAPFEHWTGTPVRLADFDGSKGEALWPAFCALAGLPAGLPTLDVPRYPTPDRDAVQLMTLLNMVREGRSSRGRIMAAWFGAPPPSAPGADQSLLPPATRVALLDRFDAASASFAAARGYAPNLAALRTQLADEQWTAPEAIPLSHLNHLLDVTAQEAGTHDTERTAQSAPAKARRDPGTLRITIKPRPWVVRLWGALRRTARR